MAQLTRRYDADDLKRFAPSKRYALVACFLAETQKTLLDQTVAMNDQYLTTMCRRSRNAFEAQHREFRRRVKKALETLLAAAEILVDPQQPRETILDVLDRRIDRDALCAARDDCREFQRLEERGYVDELSARYAYLRRYLPSFFDLSFQGETGAGPLLEGLALARALNRGERKELPLEAPVQFIPAAWRSASKRDDGTIDRPLWEIALALAVRDALRSGDLYLPESRRHVSFWNLLTEEGQWTEQRESAYAALALPSEADRVLERLAREFDDVAWRTERGLGGNPFAAVREGRLHLKRPDALEIPQRVEELRRVIETHLPRVRIEDLLTEVDSWCGFLGAFCPLGGYQPRSDNLDVALPAALIAHGTNLGIAAMGNSAEGVTVDMLQHVSRWFLREETLRAANAVLVDYHNRLDLSSVWGDGTRSSSDGQRFGVRASSLPGVLYPRYFGYYDRAVTVYTHTSDQFSVFGSRAISCPAREALYVLDGLLIRSTRTLSQTKAHSPAGQNFELEVGAMLETWCRSRYPKAEVMRTSAPGPRARLYGMIASGALARLYPQGVPYPYGNHGRVFWQEIQYLISVAAFAESASNDGQRTLAIADHEQLRALAAARQVAPENLALFALWPCPRLGWVPPRIKTDETSTRYAERLLSAVKNEKRRMYRAPGPHEILYTFVAGDVPGVVALTNPAGDPTDAR